MLNKYVSLLVLILIMAGCTTSETQIPSSATTTDFIQNNIPSLTPEVLQSLTPTPVHERQPSPPPTSVAHFLTITPTPTSLPPNTTSLDSIPVTHNLPGTDAALPVGSIRRIGIGTITSSALHPDGETLALGTATGIYIYKVPAFDQIWRRITLYPVDSVSWSPDGTLLLTGYRNYAGPTLWTADGTRLRDLEGIFEGKWSPDGNYIAVPNLDRTANEGKYTTIKLYDGRNGVFLREFDTEYSGYGIGATGTRLHWSENSDRIATSDGWGSALRVWDIDNGRDATIIIALADIEGNVYGDRPLFSGSELRLFTITVEDSTIFVRNVVDNEVWIELPNLHGDYATISSISSDFQEFIIYTDDTSYIVDTTSNNIINNLDVWADGQWMEGPDNQVMITSDFGRFTYLKNTELIQYFVAEGDIYNIYAGSYFLATGELLLIQGYGVYLLNGSQNIRYQTAYFPEYVQWDDGTLYASMGDVVKQWDILENQLTVSEDNQITTWNEPTTVGREASILSSAGYIFELIDGESSIINPNGERTSVNIDADKILWAPDGKTFASLSYIGWDADGGYISSVYTDGLVEIWDATTITKIAEVNMPEVALYTAAWSPDGRNLAVGMRRTTVPYFGGLEEHAILIVDALTGRELQRFEGHGGGTYSLAWSDDGNSLASASLDGTLIWWDVSEVGNSE